MKTLRIYKAKGLMLLCFFLFWIPNTVFAKDFVVGDPILEEKAAEKIEEMGSELFQKSGVKVFLIVRESGGEDIIAYEKNFAKNMTSPYVLLTFFRTEKKVDIYNSSDLDKVFDKEGILSPLPWKGTILPILTGKKNEHNVDAALLNGYADIVDQIADSYRVKLESSIGSSNKTTIAFVKLGVYGFVGFLILIMLYRRMKHRG
jgi:hypothetical protein